MDRSAQSKIDQLKSKQEVLKARIQSISNKEKKREQSLSTRKKILLGGYFLEQYQANNELDKLKTLMDKYLIKPLDRKLFALEPLSPAVKSEEQK